MSKMVQVTTDVADASKDHPVKMDAALKAKWVAALRSGKYRQTQNELARGGGYCCLGVLCLIADIPVNSEVNSGTYRKLDVLTGDYGPLVELNDSKRKTFPEIADYIEANL